MMYAFLFTIIAAMRVIQKICSKSVSREIAGPTYFHYGGYYQLLSAIFSIVAVAIVGFYGFDLTTLLLAVATAVFLAINIFSSTEALKTAPLIVLQMFSAGSIVVPCIVGIFLFDEPMGIGKWIAMFIFIGAMCLLVYPPKEKREKKEKMSFKTIVLLLIDLLSNGMVMVVQKCFSKLVPNGNTSVYSFLMFLSNAVILYAAYFVIAGMKKNRETVSVTDAETGENQAREVKVIRPLSKTLFVCGAFLAFALFAINYIVTELGRTMDSSVLFTVSFAISILITVLIGCFYYKEKMTPVNIVGLLLGLVSTVMLNLF